MFVVMVDVPTIPRGCEYAILGIRNAAKEGWQAFPDLRFYGSPDKGAMDRAEDEMRDAGTFHIWRFAIVRGPANAVLTDTAKVRQSSVGELSSLGTFNSDIINAVTTGIDKVNYDRDMSAGVDQERPSMQAVERFPTGSIIDCP